MVIDTPTAQRFIQTYMAFLSALVSRKKKEGKELIELLVEGRERYYADRSLLDNYRASHPQADAEMLNAIAQSRVGRWVHMKDTRAYSVVLDVDATHTYAVLGLTQPLRSMAR